MRKEQRENYSVNGTPLPSEQPNDFADAGILVGELNCHIAHGNRRRPNAKDLLNVFMSLGGDSVLTSNINCNIELILYI